MKPFVFEGIVAAPFLPMLPNQDVDWATLERRVAGRSVGASAKSRRLAGERTNSMGAQIGRFVADLNRDARRGRPDS